MRKQTGKRNEFQSLIKSLSNAHEKEVGALSKKVNKLEEEVNKLSRVKSLFSPLMTDIDGILEKGRSAREKMRLYLSTGKGKPTKKDWESLIKMYEVEHHDFIFSILASSKGLLSGRDFFVCMMARDGWRESNIQDLLNISSERISNIFRKINSVLFDVDSSKNFEKNIMLMNSDKRVFNFPTWIP